MTTERTRDGAPASRPSRARTCHINADTLLFEPVPARLAPGREDKPLSKARAACIQSTEAILRVLW
jgi:hypothetical protein